MQINVDEQDFRAILELIKAEFNRLYRKENTTRAVALNDLTLRLLRQYDSDQPACCPLCQEITCDWDCPNPRGGDQEEKPDFPNLRIPFSVTIPNPSSYETTDMMPGSN